MVVACVSGRTPALTHLSGMSCPPALPPMEGHLHAHTETPTQIIKTQPRTCVSPPVGHELPSRVPPISMEGHLQGCGGGDGRNHTDV